MIEEKVNQKYRLEEIMSQWPLLYFNVRALQSYWFNICASWNFIFDGHPVWMDRR